jgi:hypothetical protein
MIEFVVADRWEQVAHHASATRFVLRSDSWDDFHFKTLFGVEVLLPDGEQLDLGAVKIIKAGQLSGRTELPGGRFSSLGDQYCSLGQDIEYYEKLMGLPSDVRAEFLSALRDAAANPAIAQRFGSEPGWTTSLLRFGEANNALSVGAEVLAGTRRTEGVASFTYVRGGGSPLTIPFDFNDSGPLPGRCNVIIGYNGVGKTHLLADIANTASRVGTTLQSELVGSDITFGAVVAVSYSAFDTFEIPTTEQRGDGTSEVLEQGGATTFFGYTYCGLRRIESTEIGTDRRRRHELKSPTEIDAEFRDALVTACEREQGDSVVREALALIEQEPSFGRIGIRPSEWVDDHLRARSEVGKLSTGHKIVANIVVQLAARLRHRSLVLIDEPETHLHPPLLAALLRSIQRILDRYDSFAIVATHSPVVLQEVPAANVHVLVRFGDQSTVERPEVETYGENVGEITRHVFSLDSSATDYQGILKDLAGELSLDDIEALFPDGLSSQARALVLRAIHDGAR